MIRVTVWNENVHDRTDERVKALYPGGLHSAIAEALGEDARFTVRTATLDQPEQGLPDEVLNQTDVLFWWGHCAHDRWRTRWSSASPAACGTAWGWSCCTAGTTPRSSAA